MSTAREVLDEVAAQLKPGMEIADPERAKRDVLRVLEFASVRHGSVSGSRLAELLGTSRQNVQQRAARGGFLVRASSPNVLYPLWQFEADGRVVPGLADVITLARRKGWNDERLISWFEADRSRIDAVRDGCGAELAAELEEIRGPVTRRARRARSAPAIRDDEQQMFGRAMTIDQEWATT
jgi:hypothetical protein